MRRDKTLVALAAVTTLFLALVLLTCLGGMRTERLCGELLTSADRCLASVRAGDVSDAETQLAVLQEQWSRHRLFLSATQSHEDLDQVNAALQAASLQLSDNCTDEFYAEIAEIRDTIDKMRDVQSLSLENIL